MHTTTDDATTSVRVLENWTVAPIDPQRFPIDVYRPDSKSTSTNLWQLWQDEQLHFYRLALRWMNGSADDAAEGLQRAAIKVWQATYVVTRAIANLMGWLTGLVRHSCLDLHREQARYSCHLDSLDNDLSEAMAYERIATPSSQSPEACLLRREKLAYIHASIDALPKRLRIPLILRGCQELSYGAIGARLNISPECVRKRVQEARALLRRQLHSYQLNLSGSLLNAQWPEADRLFEYDVDKEIADSAEVTATLPRVVVLDRVSKREEQKLNTLRAYVERHSAGWKKRLALADQLCKMGQRAEAVDAYQKVLQKQPQLLNVWLQVGHLYQEFGVREDAVAAYEHALPLAKSKNERAFVCGLIESIASVSVAAD